MEREREHKMGEAWCECDNKMRRKPRVTIGVIDPDNKWREAMSEELNRDEGSWCSYYAKHDRAKEMEKMQTKEAGSDKEAKKPSRHERKWSEKQEEA